MQNETNTIPGYSEPPQKRSNLRENLSTLSIIIAAPLLALFMINFVFQTYEVDGPSMERTLQDNDRLIVWKVPKTWSMLTGKDYIPKRYDIIVFTHKGGFGLSGSTEKQLIKRVIGLPGDRVVINEGVVTIFNTANPNGFLVDDIGPEAEVITTTSGNIDQVVKEGEVFVMGDNRENSLDSRSLGTVRADDIIGKLSLRIYPVNKFDKY
jgi:signal peptidase I